MIPIAGSAYTYAYVTLGELVAWIIGWDLILEYAVGNVAVAVSLVGLLQVVRRRLRRAPAGVAGRRRWTRRAPTPQILARRAAPGRHPDRLQPAGGRHRRALDGAPGRRRQGVGARQLDHRRAQDRARRSASSASAASGSRRRTGTRSRPTAFTASCRGGVAHLLLVHRLRRRSRRRPRRRRTRSAICRIGMIASLVICTVLYIAVTRGA